MQVINLKRPSRKTVILIAMAVILLSVILVFQSTASQVLSTSAQADKKSDYIKWVEFNVTYEALEKAMKLDIETHEEEHPLHWIELLSYLGARYGGDFSRYKASDLDSLAEKLKGGQTMEELTKDMKYYSYYYEAYSAVLDQFVGEYKVQVPVEGSDQLEWKEKYGLKAFSPIAKTFPFDHYDDFGASRSYGFSRPHVGHDLMAATGTPVVAIESGTVEVMGWNQYGGWRVGIRSFDKKRYYYYAHLRKDRPFHADLAEGKVVKAGDVIGYVGRTGYSTKENVNNISTSHLHVGMELIFDESQKECNSEIWIDLYAITRLLQKNQSAVTRIAETKEFYRTYEIQDGQLTQ
ncbi:MAG: M23 family metallopeptidase [Clostridiales bacterium]|jgi:murein DD-endopeptidase MepM/ murein hydrolase activator NlpD|nr:M23 family metallopeptidase [Clostridiales bacterium]